MKLILPVYEDSFPGSRLVEIRGEVKSWQIHVPFPIHSFTGGSKLTMDIIHGSARECELDGTSEKDLFFEMLPGKVFILKDFEHKVTKTPVDGSCSGWVFTKKS